MVSCFPEQDATTNIKALPSQKWPQPASFSCSTTLVFGLKTGIFCSRIQCPLQENRKSLDDKDLYLTQKGAYKPAYKKSQKRTG